MHGRTYKPEQLHSLSDRQPTALTEQRDRLALNVFHHDERAAIRRLSSVEDGSDIRVGHRRQGLPFGAKPLNQRGPLHALANHFDGDELEVLIVGPYGEIDNSHPPAVQLAN